MFDALYGSNRVRGIQVCGIRGLSAHKKVGNTIVLLDRSESADLPSAQNLETPESAPRLHRLIVAPGEYRERQSFGRFLPRALAREGVVAYRHTELRGFACISCCDVGLDLGQMLFSFRDLPRQVANLPTDMTLLIAVNGAKLVQLAQFRVDLDFFNDGRITRSNRLDLRIGESAALQILRRAHRGFSPHHLLDEAGLGFQGLPHVGVK